MRLALKDVVSLFDVPEEKIQHWIQRRNFPNHLVRDSMAFDRMEVLEWATVTGTRVSPEILRTLFDPHSLPSLLDALTCGGIHYGIVGADMHAVFAAIIRVLNLPKDVDREFLQQVLLARESLGSTGVEDGVAIPHPRSPIVLNSTPNSVSLCFLEQPIEWKAIDGKPVQVMFVLMTPSIHSHLHLLSRLAFLLHDAEVQEAMRAKAKPQRILEVFRKAEAEISPQSA